MKNFRNILLSAFIFLCLLCSCSGGTDSGESAPQQEKEGIEKKEENPYEEEDDEDEDETEEDVTKDSEEEIEDSKIENTENISKEIPPVPIFLYCKMVSENKIIFGFSQPVTMVSLDFGIELNFEKSEKGKTIAVSLAENLEDGKVLIADFLAEDAYGNSVKKQVPFSTTASLAPALQINELRTEYSKPKAEFIELKMLSDGNLSALRVFVAGNNKNPLVYEFSPVEVKAGEYAVLHLRKLDDACKDEYGVRLDESGGTDSSPTARDFWIPGSSKLLHKTDAVYVLDQNDWVLDAVVISEKPDSLWGKDYFAKAAEFLFNENAWKSPAGEVCSPADAVDTSVYKTAATLSISRKEAAENTHTAADWYVTKAGGATPGLPNKP
jgi:hypothetical protein